MRRAHSVAVRGGWRLAAALVATAALAACGSVRGGNFKNIDQSNIPFGLAEPSSTTTTVTPTTLPAVTTLPVATTTTVPTDRVELFFAVHSNVIGTSARLPSPVTLDAVLAALVAGPPPDAGVAGVRGVLRREHIGSVSMRFGIATVDVTKAFTELSNVEQRLAVAQLVLTLTGRPGVGQVAFTVEGQPVDVPRGDGSLGAGPVTREDYFTLIA